MRQAKFVGDRRDQFTVGQEFGVTFEGLPVKVTKVFYDKATDRTIVDGEPGQPDAPQGMRLRYYGGTDPDLAPPESRDPIQHKESPR